jgi:D-alanyl-lipoteichoic acid acyltransferase DltB (MBOAT superfamily)
LRENIKKSLLAFGIISNLSLLGYFKYSNFFIEALNLYSDSQINLLSMSLPLGISFYTFQQIAYLADSHKNKVKNTSITSYSLFVLFFPQLIAGPIIHHKEVIPQFNNISGRLANPENISKGILLFSIGLFKKVMIADYFAFFSNNGFENTAMLYLLESWIACVSFGFQLYFDFSAYSDMAMGIALLFNIKLPENFRSPYKAATIKDYWSRWHITLSHFLRDYISIPLKKGGVPLHYNIILTFLISGIWHGAGFTFIIWGLLHGFALVVQDIWEKKGLKIPLSLAWVVTFVFLTITRVFFRAEDVNQAFKMMTNMTYGQIVLPSTLNKPLEFLSIFSISFGNCFEHIGASKWTIMALTFAFVHIFFFKRSTEIVNKFQPNLVYLIFTLFLLIISYFNLNNENQFYYFMF